MVGGGTRERRRRKRLTRSRFVEVVMLRNRQDLVPRKKELRDRLRKVGPGVRGSTHIRSPCRKGGLLLPAHEPASHAAMIPARRNLTDRGSSSVC